MTATETARRVLEGSSRAVVLTGAGVSAESGIPTFRGDDGLWRDYRPEELATPAAFARDPRLVWEWYSWRRQTVSDCDPNPAHLAIARWMLHRPEVLLVTQNVDDLHLRALRAVSGESDRETDREILRLHGSLFRVRCTGCAHGAPHREPVEVRDESSLPRCPRCEELLRPDVVWFGESLDRDLLERALTGAREADVCLVVGTSAVVQPAASVATVAKQAGASLIEVNPEETPVSDLADVSLRSAAGEALPTVLGPSDG